MNKDLPPRQALGFGLVEAVLLFRDGLAGRLGLAPVASEPPLLSSVGAVRGQGENSLELVHKLRAEEGVEEGLVHDVAGALNVQHPALWAWPFWCGSDAVHADPRDIPSNGELAGAGFHQQLVGPEAFEEDELGGRSCVAVILGRIDDCGVYLSTVLDGTEQ